MSEYGRQLVLAEQPLGVRPCSIAAALEIVGERWTLPVIREIGYGVHRFARIAAYTGASRDMLADRLRKLAAAGIIERRQYSAHPPRFEYHLTQAGSELFPVLVALREWGDHWAVDEPAVQILHDCQHPLTISLTCSHCGTQVTPASITAVLPPASTGPASTGPASTGPASTVTASTVTASTETSSTETSSAQAASTEPR